MAIRIKVEKKVNGKGEKGYVIKDFKMLDKDDLPERYFEDYPHCYKFNDYWINIKVNRDENFDVHKREFLTQKEFEEFIDLLNKCGDRLREVNQKIKEMEEEWNGTVEFII